MVKIRHGRHSAWRGNLTANTGVGTLEGEAFRIRGAVTSGRSVGGTPSALGASGPGSPSLPAMSKLGVLAKITAQPGTRDDVVAALAPMIDVAAKEPGTEVYVMHTANDEPDVVWFYELYSDAAALQAHGGSEAMKQAGGRLAGLVAGRPDLIMVTPVNGAGITV